MVISSVACWPRATPRMSTLKTAERPFTSSIRRIVAIITTAMDRQRRRPTPARRNRVPSARRRIVGNVAQQTGDTPDLGPHPRGHDRGTSTTVRRGGAAEDHVDTVAKGDVTGKGRGRLREWHALAGERGFGNLQSRRLDDARIGGDGVAGLDDQDVSGDDLRRQQASRLAISDHTGVCRGHLSQCGDRRFCPRFLDEPDAGVEQHDGPDGEGLVAGSVDTFAADARRG